MTNISDPYAPYQHKKELSFIQNALSYVPLFNKSSSTQYTNDKNATEGDKEENSGLIGKIFNAGSNITESLTEKVNDAQEAAENYKMGLLLLVIGGFILFFSSLYLPFIAIFPQKFCSLFSFGSVVIMIALGTMIGQKKFFKVIYSKVNLPYATLYTISLILGLYYSLNGGHYLLVLVLCIMQFFSLSHLLFLCV